MDLDIKAGGTGSLALTFAQTEINEQINNFSVNLGIDAGVGIFSASVEAAAEFVYGRHRETTYEKSFQMEWNNPGPANPVDPNNISKFTAISYVMKTTGPEAYYLLDGFKDYTPYFITYEVTDIHREAFGGSSIDDNSISIDKYKFTNYPNPCSDQSKFTWSLPGKSQINLSVYNTYGQKVSTPVNEIQVAGEHQIDFYTSGLANGIYYYRLLIDQDLITGKMIVNR